MKRLLLHVYDNAHFTRSEAIRYKMRSILIHVDCWKKRGQKFANAQLVCCQKFANAQLFVALCELSRIFRVTLCAIDVLPTVYYIKKIVLKFVCLSRFEWLSATDEKHFCNFHVCEFSTLVDIKNHMNVARRKLA